MQQQLCNGGFARPGSTHYCNFSFCLFAGEIFIAIYACMRICKVNMCKTDIPPNTGLTAPAFLISGSVNKTH